MKVLSLAIAPVVLAAAPALAQTAHDPAGHAPAPAAAHDPATSAAADPHAGHGPASLSASPAADPHVGHGLAPAAVPDAHAGHAMGGAPDIPTSVDSVGVRLVETPPPAAARSEPAHAADLVFDPAEMAAARRQLRIENGDVRTTAVLIDSIEAAFGEGDDGFGWNAQGWTGGDIHRFWWKTEGEGELGGKIDEVEVQALYSRAIAPFWDVQAGVRQDYRRDGRDTTYLTAGVQGVAPYWFEMGAAAFLSTDGDLTVRAEAEYDLRLTQRWILQPALEIDLAAQDIPERELGAGLTSVSAGLRLRYEIRKEFAPYVGVEWSRALGKTADDLEAQGGQADDTRLLVGLRAWF